MAAREPRLFQFGGPGDVGSPLGGGVRCDPSPRRHPDGDESDSPVSCFSAVRNRRSRVSSASQLLLLPGGCCA